MSTYAAILVPRNVAILIMLCLAVGLFGFLLFGTLYVSWIWVTFSLIRSGKFSIITFSNKSSIPCPSILCQFWLCEEAQCVYLRRHLGSPTLLFLRPHN